MRQQAFPAARPGEAQFLHNDRLFRLGNHRAVKVGALAVLIALKFLEAALVIEPFISQELATIHATDRNDHRTTLSDESIGPQLWCRDNAKEIIYIMYLFIKHIYRGYL